MTYEVELKFSVPDLAPVRDWLRDMNGQMLETVDQRDDYFQHPSRDFRETGEALRLRHEGAASWITYKGPVLDRAVKTRREIELPLGETELSGPAWTELLQLLGFQPVASVCKRRESWQIVWDGEPMTIALDDVQDVGTYVEFERIATDDTRELARQAVLAAAHSAGLTTPESRSYLRMLLEGVRVVGG